MPSHLLFVETVSGALAETLGTISNSAFRHTSTTWSSFRVEQITDGQADLIVAAAAPLVPDATAFFRHLLRQPMRLPVLAILPDDCPDEVMRAAAATADEFVVAPVRPGELLCRVRRILGETDEATAQVRGKLCEETELARLVGAAPAFVATLRTLPAIARSGRSVVITGETGTGKDLCARAIHHLSPRKWKPFIAMDCAALPEHLFENEVFGHVRGAFTDARADQLGLIRMADGGTLFLDEVDALAPAAQAKLLRFLQDRTYRPIGADRFLTADVTVLAATNRDLDALVRDGRFRSDLYFRLNVIRVHLPPLRERRGDIPLLARHFLERLSLEIGCGHKTLSQSALQHLLAHDWPGNIRELFNVLQSAIVYAEGPVVRAADLTALGRAAPPDLPDRGLRHARAAVIETFERRYVEELLRQSSGNVTHAAAAAKKDRRAFGRLMKKYGIDRAAVARGTTR
jgi:DNA-binding NtrC family response regulator